MKDAIQGEFVMRMKTALFLCVLLAIVALSWSSAQAGGVRIGIGLPIGIGVGVGPAYPPPYYYRPYPYYYPYPYYGYPYGYAPVYVQPAPVYAQPAPAPQQYARHSRSNTTIRRLQHRPSAASSGPADTRATGAGSTIACPYAGDRSRSA